MEENLQRTNHGTAESGGERMAGFIQNSCASLTTQIYSVLLLARFQFDPKNSQGKILIQKHQLRVGLPWRLRLSVRHIHLALG